MESPRQPPYDVSELEEWLQGVRIYRNPGRDDPGSFDETRHHAALDEYSAEIEWDDGRVTRIRTRKQTIFPIRSKYQELISLGIIEESYWQHFWDSFNISHLLQPYSMWTATFDPLFYFSDAVDHESGFRSYREREGDIYPNGPSKKIFKLMKRMYEAQK